VPVRLRLLSGLIRAYLRLVHATSRWETSDAGGRKLLADGKPVIIAFWHGRMAMMAFSKPGKIPVTVLVSRNRDGGLISNIVAPFNIPAVRGSARKPGKADDKGGASALRALRAVLEGGQAVAITPDGPRGPAGSIAPGILYLAQATGAPIVPLACATRARRILKSWDGFHFPLPFTRGAFVWGAPLAVSDDTPPEQIAEALNTVTLEADRRVGRAS